MNILISYRKFRKYFFVFFTLTVLIFIYVLIINKTIKNRSESIVTSEACESDNTNTNKDTRANACIILLCRESELNALIKSIINFETRFNSRHHYDYVFLNEVEFSDSFKAKIRSFTKSVVKFGVVPKEQWSYPPHIDQEKARISREKMKDTGAMYPLLESYRFMCRFFSGFFFRHPLVLEYDYYWRIEPGIDYKCDINYDPFKFLIKYGYEYGFTITVKDHPATIRTLWNETEKFLNNNPQYFDAKSNNLNFIINSTKQYNLCHYWSNFEIASFKLWRSERYLKYFEHLEQAGGFFYERWGDAPVHSIALSIFLPKSKVVFFEDIGYYHFDYLHCPITPSVFTRCDCTHEKAYHWHPTSCLKQWYNSNPLNNFIA